jgi:hypothetical protein
MPDRHTANPTAPGVSTKRQIETQLHAKLETAKTGYESVSEAHQLTLKHCEELRLKNHLDGNGNGHQAPYVGTVDLPNRKGTARRPSRNTDGLWTNSTDLFSTEICPSDRNARGWGGR